MTHLIKKYFPKKGWFFRVIFSRTYFLLIILHFQPFSIAKADSVAATLFKNATLKFETDAGFSFGQDSVPFSTLF
jgi:NTE family protein